MNILFDLDGTLTDPFEGIYKSLCHGLQCVGIQPPAPHALKWCIGPPINDSIAKLVGNTDLEAPCLAFFRERYTTVGIYENALYDGIPEALLALTEAGHTLYLATSKPGPFARRVLDHFELTVYFTEIYGSEFNGTRANKAELIAHLMERETLTPERCIMVGDREHDVRGARAHGVDCIGVLYGYGSEVELANAGAVALCNTPSELLREIDLIARH